MIFSDLIALILFCSAAAFSPGPNNFMASYSAFNFGLKKTLPIIYGVTFGFPLLIFSINFGLSIIFKQYPEIQKIITIAGTFFLIYMAYRIATTKNFKITSSLTLSQAPLKVNKPLIIPPHEGAINIIEKTTPKLCAQSGKAV